MAKYISKTQQKRKKYDYRTAYFEKNPGLFNTVWFCSQCGKPLFGKDQVVIDHIVPLSKGGINHVSNCTACCYKCNSRKSDIVDYRIIRGFVFKFFESNLFRAQRGVLAVIGLLLGLTMSAVCTALQAFIKFIKFVTNLLVNSVYVKRNRRSKNIISKVSKSAIFPIKLFVCIVFVIAVLYVIYSI